MRPWHSVQFLGATFLALCLVACAAGTPTPGDASGGANLPRVRMDLDLNKVALTPADIADLFPGTSYSISQPMQGADMHGLTVIYPTEVAQHTSAFSAGFSTQIQVFADVQKATEAYAAAVAREKGKALDIGQLANASQAFRGPAISPEGFELGKFEYLILLRQQNAFVVVTIRTDQDVTPARLGELARLVLARLNS